MNKHRNAEDIFLEITELCAELGWLIAMEESSSGSISGVVAGTGSYVVGVLDELDNGEAYSIYKHGTEDETEVH